VGFGEMDQHSLQERAILRDGNYHDVQVHATRRVVVEHERFGAHAVLLVPCCLDSDFLDALGFLLFDIRAHGQDCVHVHSILDRDENFDVHGTTGHA